MHATSCASPATPVYLTAFSHNSLWYCCFFSPPLWPEGYWCFMLSSLCCKHWHRLWQEAEAGPSWTLRGPTQLAYCVHRLYLLLSSGFSHHFRKCIFLPQMQGCKHHSVMAYHLPGKRLDSLRCFDWEFGWTVHSSVSAGPNHSKTWDSFLILCTTINKCS